MSSSAQPHAHTPSQRNYNSSILSSNSNKNPNLNSDQNSFMNPNLMSNSNAYKSINNSIISNDNFGSVSQSYVNSRMHSKQQTPIKSPSPDQARMNMITPTKVKYIGGGGIDRRQIQQGWSSHTSPFNPNNNQSSTYTKNLQHQLQILTIQNRNLLQKLSSLPSPSPSPSTQHNLRRTQSSTLIIQRIKQQYEQKLNTLKLMIEQQIKQAMNVIQDMCQLMKNKIIVLEQRISGVEERVVQVKVGRIMEMEEMMMMRGTGKVVESISQILCVSIPEESEEQSRSHNTTQVINPLQPEIQHLRTLLSQTSQSYNTQIYSLNSQIHTLTKQLTALQQQQLKRQQQISKQQQKLQLQLQLQLFRQKQKQKQKNQQNLSSKFKYHIREQLLNLQQNVQELVLDLQKKEELVAELVGMLEVKGAEVEVLGRELWVLRGRLLDGDKMRVVLEQKIRALQQQNKILQHQTSRTHNQLQNLQQKTHISFSHLLQNTANNPGTNEQRLHLSERIKNLLHLEQQLQLQGQQGDEHEHDHDHEQGQEGRNKSQRILQYKQKQKQRYEEEADQTRVQGK